MFDEDTLNYLKDKQHIKTTDKGTVIYNTTDIVRKLGSSYDLKISTERNIIILVENRDQEFQKYNLILAKRCFPEGLVIEFESAIQDNFDTSEIINERSYLYSPKIEGLLEETESKDLRYFDEQTVRKIKNTIFMVPYIDGYGYQRGFCFSLRLKGLNFVEIKNTINNSVKPLYVSQIKSLSNCSFVNIKNEVLPREPNDEDLQKATKLVKSLNLFNSSIGILLPGNYEIIERELNEEIDVVDLIIQLITYVKKLITIIIGKIPLFEKMRSWFFGEKEYDDERKENLTMMSLPITASSLLSEIAYVWANFTANTILKFKKIRNYVFKLFSKYLTRKMEKGGASLTMFNVDKIEEEGKANLIVSLEKVHFRDALIYAEEEVTKKKKAVVRQLTIICVATMSVSSILIGRPYIAIITMILSLILTEFINYSQNLDIAAILLIPNWPSKIMHLIHLMIRRIVPDDYKSWLTFGLSPFFLWSATGFASLAMETKKEWSQFAKHEFLDTQYQISEYWQKQGLKNDTENNCCVINMVDSEKENKMSTDYGYDLVKDGLLSDYSKEKAKNWSLSDMSDLAFVKALNKRILHKKNEVNLIALEKFRVTMLRLYSNMKVVEKLSIDERISKALSTEGTAGEFAKHTVLESIWKDQTNKDIMLTWSLLHKFMLKRAILKETILQKDCEYRLYKKREALEIDEDGIKATRLMQAPNLIRRVSDSIELGSFNDSIVERRYENSEKLGINIAYELPCFLIITLEKIYIMSDFSQYDSSEHPYQAFACCETRLTALHNSGLLRPTQAMYHIQKYKERIFRQVEDSNGSSYKIIGQLATGDFVTGDDHTMKSSTYFEMCIEGLEGNYKAAIGGDDITIRTEKDPTVLMRNMKEIAISIGWVLKSLSIGGYGYNLMDIDAKGFINNRDIENYESPDFYAHTVRPRFFMKEGSEYNILIPMIYREKTRPYGKFRFLPEQPKLLNKHTKESIVAKCMSYIIMLINNIELAIEAIFVLSLFEEGPSTFKNPYSWTNVKINPNVIMYISKLLKIHIMVEVDVDSILITRKEQENLVRIIKEHKRDDCLYYIRETSKEGIYSLAYDELINYIMMKKIINNRRSHPEGEIIKNFADYIYVDNKNKILDSHCCYCEWCVEDHNDDNQKIKTVLVCEQHKNIARRKYENEGDDYNMVKHRIVIVSLDKELKILKKVSNDYKMIIVGHCFSGKSTLNKKLNNSVDLDELVELRKLKVINELINKMNMMTQRWNQKIGFNRALLIDYKEKSNKDVKVALCHDIQTAESMTENITVINIDYSKKENRDICNPEECEDLERYRYFIFQKEQYKTESYANYKTIRDYKELQ